MKHYSTHHVLLISNGGSFFFTGTEPHDPEDNDSDSPRRSTAGPSHTVVDSDSESNVEILPPDDNADASPQEEPVRGRRGKPSPVQKRGGARRSSPKDKGKCECSAHLVIVHVS